MGILVPAALRAVVLHLNFEDREENFLHLFFWLITQPGVSCFSAPCLSFSSCRTGIRALAPLCRVLLQSWSGV